MGNGDPEQIEGQVVADQDSAASVYNKSIEAVNRAGRAFNRQFEAPPAG
jgi:hypothetical protein